MSYLNSVPASLIARRSFLLGAGAAVTVLSACRSLPGMDTGNSASTKINEVVNAKLELIADAKTLMAVSPELSAPLAAVIDHNLLHIEALKPHALDTTSSSPSPSQTKAITLPGLSTRCAVFSNNNLRAASSLSDPELSRLLALIAGSEIQHHELLNGFIS